jgi:CRISPR-associated exonuclease Cas4
VSFDEDDLLPISGLQHLLFCERQWGLIHIEQQWEENRLTAEGWLIHERAHEAGVESRPGVRIARGLRLHSLELGIAGQADVVEFHPSAAGIALPEMEGRWRPSPVKYKRGKPKRDRCDEVQFCAQALCLEEMFGGHIAGGALYYAAPRRRVDVPFDAGLRMLTRTLARRMHELYESGRTPPAVYEPKCDSCSLMGICMPRLVAKPPVVARYLARAKAAGEE